MTSPEYFSCPEYVGTAGINNYAGLASHGLLQPAFTAMPALSPPPPPPASHTATTSLHIVMSCTTASQSFAPYYGKVRVYKKWSLSRKLGGRGIAHWALALPLV